MRTVLLIAGVAGSGKTTVAERLGQALGWQTFDADQLHPPGSIEKMSAGIELSSHDRWPWLASVASVIGASSGSAVVACSALRQEYRAYLSDRVSGLQVCLLEVPPQVVEDRLADRRGHFMAPSLLQSQLSTLEPLADSEPGFTINGDQEVKQVVRDVVDGLRGMRLIP